MTDIRLPASGNFKVRWHAVNAFANPAKPTPAEVNAGLHLGNAISWNDWDFGAQASNSVNDPAITSKSNVADRGAQQYGGSISFYYPKVFTDNSNELALVRAALRLPETLGYITIQLDGELSENNVATYAGGITQTAVSGDLIHVYKVETAGYSEVITGEEAFRYTISFLPKGELYLNTVVATTLTVVTSPATLTVNVAGGVAKPVTATVNARKFTRGVRWTTSDATKATVSQNGVVKPVAVGSATITATYRGATATVAVTVGA